MMRGERIPRHIDRQPFAGELVDDGETSKLLSIGLTCPGFSDQS